MRSMLNNKKSRLILVRVSIGGWRRLVMPIPLYALDIVISSAKDLATFADLVTPFWRHKLEKRVCSSRWGAAKGLSKISLEMLVGIIAEFSRELRKQGRWRMVEVVTDDVSVYVDFY